MNEPLRRALLRARLREDDVAVRMGVDPKTVRRWLNGRVPYANNRAALADLLAAEEADLWPGVGGPLAARVRPEELEAVYPHRWAIPRQVWTRFFESAEHEIGILTYSAMFLAQDADILRILSDKGHAGVVVRIVLGDPDGSNLVERGEEGIGEAVTLFRPLATIENVEIRSHQADLYNSIYRADDQLLVNQRTYGIPDADSPVLCFKRSESGDIFSAYSGSFEKVWTMSRSLREGKDLADECCSP